MVELKSLLQRNGLKKCFEIKCFVERLMTMRLHAAKRTVAECQLIHLNQALMMMKKAVSMKVL